MGQHEDTLKDIEETFGIVPGFMKALPEEVNELYWWRMAFFLYPSLFSLSARTCSWVHHRHKTPVLQ